MKKLLNFAYAGAIALFGVGLSACSSSDDMVVEEITNPNYDPGTNTVNTQFVFNISTGNTETGTMRMTSANTQSTVDEKFRGMDNVHIMAYLQKNEDESPLNGKHLYDVSTPAKDSASRNYDLASLLPSEVVTKDLSRRVIELSLPVGANTLLFYGKAPMTATDQTSGDNLKKEDQQGSITFDPKDKATESSFTLTSRIGSNGTVFTQSADMLATIMTRIAKNGLHQEAINDDNGNNEARDLRYAFWWPIDNVSEDFATRNKEDGSPLYEENTAGTGDQAGYTFYTGSKEWYEYGDDYADETRRNAMKPLEEILGEAYNTFTTISTVGSHTEIRAGSAEAVLRLVKDLWTVTDKVANAKPTSVEEQIAKLMADRISTRFGTYFTRSDAGVLSYKSIDALKTALEQYVYGKKDAYVAVNSIDKFPINLNLPMGAAQMTFTSTKGGKRVNEFSYVTDLPTYGMTGVDNTTTTIDHYTYPAELCYFGNSPLRVSDDTHTTNEYPASVAQWDNDDFWDGKDEGNQAASTALKGATGWTKGGAVKSTTRSVAMQYDINYGTALLKSTVRCSASELNDNNRAIQKAQRGADEPDNKIAVSDGSFQLTGVIVGGMVNKVGWNFVNKGSTYTYMVYDKAIETKNVAVSPSATASTATSYTLLWDNYDAKHEKQPVYIALEFKNNSGRDFWGNANLVREGGTFYLIGKLDPDPKELDSSESKFPTRTAKNYVLPPYKADGTTDEKVRVFIQDFMTTANFLIGPNSLQSAYVTVPDLRATQVSLGLSVDIKWETGLTFDDIILGE
ncbi:MAG: hypothetical protein IJ190_10695 [Prevotella sp.]|nr:hypothetical protein [Prevotella sp.]